MRTATSKYLIAIALAPIAWSLALVILSTHAQTVTSLTGGHLTSSRPDPDRQGYAAPVGAPLEDSRTQVLRAYANLPLTFVENRGQTDTRVRYYAQGSRYAFYLTREEIVLSFVKGSNAPDLLGRSNASSEARSSTLGARGLGARAGATAAAAEEPTTHGVTLALRFLGGNPRVVVEGEERAPGEVNYFRGNDPARWRTQLPRYAQVVYRELWPGVDLMLRGQAGALKYEFRVRPGARLANIALGYRGSAGLALDSAGGLLIETSLGVLRDSPPVAYQEIAGARVPVESRYALERSSGGESEYGFTVGAGYDPNHELIIDPGLDYSTFLGGSAHESAQSVAVDGSGNAYVAGFTQSPDFPTTSGAFDRTGAASNSLEAFVTKVNSNGTALFYSTFLGGSNFEWGRAIAVDVAGNAYVAGQTKSSDFPTTSGAFDRSFNVDSCPRCGIDQYDAFVTKLNAAGSGLVYSTFLGGFDFDDALAIAIDGSGNAYLGGETGSSNFPVTAGAFDTTRNGAYDAFVTKLNATGSALAYSTYLGGLEVEFSAGAAVDASGSAYITGITRSANFPTTVDAFDTMHNGMFDVFVTRLNAAGSALVYSTFLGGVDFDSVGGIVIDGGGNAYVAGSTGSPDFPTTPGAFDRTTDGDAYVTKLNPAGTDLVYSTFVGGSSFDGAADVLVDGSGNAWIAGGTSSPDFPTTPGTAFDTTINGGGDVFLAQLDAAGSAVLHGTFLGGTDNEGASDLAFDPGGNIIVVGETSSTDFPTTPGAFDRVWNGDPLIFWADAFVAKLAVGSALPPPPPPTPTAPTLLSPANNATVAQPVTFDWNDVANATSYEIQVDNSSTIAAPFTANYIVSGSQATIGGLPAQRLWWRARARNAAGVFGPFSATRRFTPQAATGAPSLSSLSLSPTSVVGGASATGAVTLTSAAPAAGAVVTLASSNPAVAGVPASVTVAGGGTSASFTVTTSAVTTSTAATITGTFGGASRSTTLTVNPPSSTATLTVSATGRSGERVTSSPAGINVAVGNTQSASFAANSSITLSISNGRDAIWSGACSSGGNKTRTCTFTINGNVSVSANVQ